MTILLKRSPCVNCRTDDGSIPYIELAHNDGRERSLCADQAGCWARQRRGRR